MVLIARFSNVYLPDYATRYLDIGFDLNSYYKGELRQEGYLRHVESEELDDEEGQLTDPEEPRDVIFH